MGNFYPPAFGVAVKIFSTAFKVYKSKLIGVDMLQTQHKKCKFVSWENYATQWPSSMQVFGSYSGNYNYVVCFYTIYHIWYMVYIYTDPSILHKGRSRFARKISRSFAGSTHKSAGFLMSSSTGTSLCAAVFCVHIHTYVGTAIPYISKYDISLHSA